VRFGEGSLQKRDPARLCETRQATPDNNLTHSCTRCDCSSGGKVGEELASVFTALKHMHEQLQEIQHEGTLNGRPWEGLLQRLQDREERDVDRNIVEPLLHQLILIYDRVSRENSEATKNVLEGVREDVLGVLAIYGVEVVTVPSPRFESRFQKCIGHRPASAPSADGIVAERVRTGFRRGERILRFEEVLVWRYQQQHGQHAEEES
jgi:molecular chaperone GrpE (heat shock protein)